MFSCCQTRLLSFVKAVDKCEFFIPEIRISMSETGENTDLPTQRNLIKLDKKNNPN